MSARFRSLMRTIAVGAGLVWIVALAVAAAQQPGPNAVAIDNDDIGGVVRSASGPEAGVWVIAETSELPTKFAKIVVTDDAGRYLIPDLPKANYGSQVLGWINTKMFDATHDEVKSQGWTGLILDTNGNGKRDAYVKPNQPIDPAKDKQIDDALYIAVPAPDGSIWGSVLGYPGAIIRVVPGANPTETALAERYELPAGKGYSPRGMDVDRNGVARVALGSGHLASFDRRKSKGPLNGPKATGQQCPEGWAFFAQPLPQFKNVKDSGSAEGSYFAWVRSGTAAAANYGEARGAESRADFIHKLRIVLKELNETAVWLQLIVESALLSQDKTIAIVAENEELCRIIGASIRTLGGFDRS